MKKIIISCLVCLVAVVGLCFSSKSANAYITSINGVNYVSTIPVENLKGDIYVPGLGQFGTFQIGFPMYNDWYAPTVDEASTTFQITPLSSEGTPLLPVIFTKNYIYSPDGSAVSNTTAVNLGSFRPNLNFYGTEFILPIDEAYYSLLFWAHEYTGGIEVAFDYDLTINYAVYEKTLSGFTSTIREYTEEDWGVSQVDLFGGFLNQYNGSQVQAVYIYSYDINFYSFESIDLVFAMSGYVVREFDYLQYDLNDLTSHIDTSGESVSFSDWIVDAVSGFLDTDIIGSFSISDILMFILAIGLVIMIIKFFMGG